MAVCQAPLSSIISWNMLKFMSTGTVTLFNHLILYHPFSLCLQFFPASGYFQWVSSSYQVYKLLELQCQTKLSDFTFTHWRRKWKPTPVFLPGGSQGRGSLVGCHLWGPVESDTTEVTEQQQQFQHQSFQWIFRVISFRITGLISLQSNTEHQ